MEQEVQTFYLFWIKEIKLNCTNQKNCEDTKMDRNMSNEVVKQCMTFWGRSLLLEKSAADKQAAPLRKILPVVQIILLAFTFV